MKIDYKYLKKIILTIRDHSNHSMGLADLGCVMQLFEGDSKDFASLKIKRDQVGVFQAHINYLLEKGIIKTNQNNVRLLYNKNNGGDFF